MLVCSCRAVSDRAVTEVIGAGARTIEHIARGCGAGSRCGGCHPTLERLLAVRRAHDQQDTELLSA